MEESGGRVDESGGRVEESGGRVEVEWKYLINISRTLGTGLHECEHALTFTVSLRICSTNLSLALQVTLVTDQHLAYVFTSVSRVRWYFSGDGTLVVMVL